MGGNLGQFTMHVFNFYIYIMLLFLNFLLSSHTGTMLKLREAVNEEDV